MHDVPYEGAPFKLGGQEYIVPGLPWSWLETNGTKMEQITSQPFKEQISFIFDVCYTALKRNYPDITVRHLKSVLDVPTLTKLVKLVMERSGLAQGEPMPEKGPSALAI